MISGSIGDFDAKFEYEFICCNNFWSHDQE